MLADSVYPSLSSVAVSAWKDACFHLAPSTKAILATIKQHRDQGSMDDQSARAIRSCKEIFCMMGVTQHRNFKKLKSFVTKTASGMFEILDEFQLMQPQHKIYDPDPPVRLGGNLFLYREEFEKPIVDDTRAYCQGLRHVWLASESLASYRKKTQQVLDQERDRVDRSVTTTIIIVIFCLSNI